MSPTFTLIECAGVVDADTVRTPPGSGGAVLIATPEGPGDDRCRLIAAGEPSRVGTRPEATAATRIAMPDRVLIPALVNAHAHLDLSPLGPRPYDPAAGFPGWLGSIRSARAETRSAPGEGVAMGCRLLRRGGVGAVGDILGGGVDDWRAGLEALHASGLEGVAFLEVFGAGQREPRAIEAMREAARSDWTATRDRLRVGLQPHAPYSAGPGVYREAGALRSARSIPVATHVGESIEERHFVRVARGDLRAMIEAMGLWDPLIEDTIGHADTPIGHVARALAGGPWLAVHANDCSDDDIGALARTGASVVYCPRAAAYFGHERTLGAHRYRDMIDAGVNVAIGTDSILCLPPTGAESQRLSPLDEIRFLRRRDASDARTLLAMATVNGARALGLDPRRYTLTPAQDAGVAGILSVDVSATDPRQAPEARVLESDAPPQWVRPGAPSP